MIKVVCGIIYHQGKILITRRNKDKSLGGYWEFPGGKVEEGETPESALQRELEEELGMKVEITDFFTSNYHNYGDFQIDLSAYNCQFNSATFKRLNNF